MMTAEQILKKAKTTDLLHWDQKTVQAALAVKDELVPKILEHMNWFYEQVQDPEWDYSEEEEYYLNLNEYHLLAEMKETRAYPILLKFLALPQEMLECAFGDDLTEDLKSVLAATYDGSLEETEALVLNPQANEIAKCTVLEAMGLLCMGGRISREELIRFNREVLDTLVDRDNLSEWIEQNGMLFPMDDGVLLGVWLCTKLVHLHEICPDLRDLASWGALADHEYANWLDVIFNWPGAPREEWYPPKFQDGEAGDGPTAQEIEILKYSCGRNDPCPCGSGKKFKKCHLRQQEDLQMKYGNWMAAAGSGKQHREEEPVIYPPIENVGDKPGLAAYFPREAIEVDVHVYRGMKIEMGDSLIHRTTESEIRAATEELWKGFEGFEKICQEKGYATCGEYDRSCLVHYTSSRWLRLLARNLRDRHDSRLAAVEKWL